MLDLVTQRGFVIALAIVGALIVTFCNWRVQAGRLDPDKARRFGRVGYLLTGLSILLFIVAGFRAG